MNIKPHFKPIVLGALLACVSFYGHSAVDDSAVVIVKGSVTKGTCAFTLSDQTVKFSQSTLMQNVDEIGVKKKTKYLFLLTIFVKIMLMKHLIWKLLSKRDQEQKLQITKYHR